MKQATYAILPFLAIAGTVLAGSWYGQHVPVTPATASQAEVVHHTPGGMATPAGSPGLRAPGTVQVRADQQQLLGVQVQPVEQAARTHSLRLLGRVVPDESRVYRVNAGIEGFIREVAPVTTGDHVTKDQLLATFAAPNAYNVIQLYLLNLGAVERLKQSAAAGSVEAQAAPAGAANVQQRVDQLENLGMSRLQMAEIERTRQVPASLQIRAPAAGVVLARNVSPGLKFDKGAEWYRIADLTRVWILADVFEPDAQALRPGQRVTVSLPRQQRPFPATVSATPPQFDPATRTLKVRLEAENPGDLLRPDMFVDVELPITTPPTIAVSTDAVVDSGLKKTVFVERGEGIFEPRQVETGDRFGDKIQVVKGLTAGERIVVSGTFLLDSESRMKATAGATGHMHMHAAHAQHAEPPTDAAPAAGSAAQTHEGHMHPQAMEAASEATPAPTEHDHASHDHGGHDHGVHNHAGHQHP